MALLVSLAVNGPVNVEQLSWNVQAPPADGARIRDRWQIAHPARTLAIVLTLGCLSAAILDRPVHSMPARGKKTDHWTQPYVPESALGTMTPPALGKCSAGSLSGRSR